MMNLTIILLTAALLQVGAPSSTQLPTSELSGRVVDRETGVPIPRAVVHLHKFPEGDEVATQTDQDGRWGFTELTPGEYVGSADAGPFRGTHLQEPMLFSDKERGRILLKPGERRRDVNVALRRSLAITVRVVDEWGEPLSMMSVTAKSIAGSYRSMPGMLDTTDDRGRLRLSGLVRADYVVCAEAGSFPQSPGGPSQIQLLRTCYPSAIDEASAERVRVDGTDVEGIEIHMRRGRTFSISGQVLDVSGAPATSASISLERSERGMSSGGMPVSMKKDGRFSFSNLVPGNYALRATVGGSNGFVQRQPTEVGFAAVRIDAADIDGLMITMAKPVDVAGRIVLEDPAASFTVAPGWGPPFLSARLTSDKGPGYGSTSTAYPDETRSFKFEGIFGRRTIDIANVPRGWYVKSIKYRGKEVIDTPTEFGASDDPAGLEVLMSNRGGVVSGKVTDDAGKPVRGARVMLLSVNQDRWTMFASYAGTRATSAADGTYRFGPQRDGDYFVVAVPSTDMEPAGDDREKLTRLAERAERITLTLGEDRSLDLRVIKPE